jgi:TolB-like protein
MIAAGGPIGSAGSRLVVRDHAMNPGLLAALCGLALAIVPAVNPQRDRDQEQAQQPERGDEPSIRDVKLDRGALEAAREEFAGRSRIAVLPLAASKGDPAAEVDAVGCTRALTDDLRYVPAYLVLEQSEVIRTRGTLTSLPEIGRKLGVRNLVMGLLTREGGDNRLEAVVLDVEPGAPARLTPLARASGVRPVGKVYDLVDAVLLDLLGQLKTTPSPERITAMGRVPTLNDSARALCDDGLSLIDRSSGLGRDDERAVILRALRESEAALHADPLYQRAALLQASCLMKLGDSARLETCLTQAYDAQVPASRLDELTRLEIEGDYAAFVKRDLTGATERYRKMLELDPGHLHALWMLSALHAGEYGSPDWPERSLEKAASYAARIVVAHPASAPARLFIQPRQ